MPLCGPMMAVMGESSMQEYRAAENAEGVSRHRPRLRSAPWVLLRGALGCNPGRVAEECLAESLFVTIRRISSVSNINVRWEPTKRFVPNAGFNGLQIAPVPRTIQ